MTRVKQQRLDLHMAYRGLEDLKERLGLDSSLKWHSFRIGSATKGNILGVRRSVMKKEGWFGDMLTLCDILVSATRKISSFNR